jgi:hypothetical protein
MWAENFRQNSISVDTAFSGTAPRPIGIVAMSNQRIPLLGRLAVHNQMITMDQLAEATGEQGPVPTSARSWSKRAFSLPNSSRSW